MKRITKDEYYLEIAKLVSKRGTCIRRNYGAVIVKDDHIVSTGYTGSPRGMINCIDIGICPRNDAGCEQGNGYDLCVSVHAEQNAIITADPDELNGSIMFVACDVDSALVRPCKLCRSMIINAKIGKVICPNKLGKPHVVYENFHWYDIDGHELENFMSKGQYGY